MISAFGVEHAFSKGLSPAAQKSLKRLANRPSKKGEWAEQRLQQHQMGAMGQISHGKNAAKIQRGIYPKIEKKPKGTPVGLRESAGVRRTRMVNLKKPSGRVKARRQNATVLNNSGSRSMGANGRSSDQGRLIERRFL